MKTSKSSEQGRWRRKQVAALGALLCLWAALPGHAYYHFLHYGAGNTAASAAPERFELEALPGKTLPVLVAQQGPQAFREGDSFPSLISHLRMALKVWDEVPASALRLRFAGLFDPRTEQSSPRVEVLFDELPPGLLAMGGPTSRLARVSAPGGDFVPITRSVVVLANDFSNLSLANDNFFLTLVHELGHALGLQHTLSSSVMSTSVTRATTKAKPLSNDDVAGLAALYPARGWNRNSGTISGKVLLGGKGVHLASVVAIRPSDSATSAFTHPDGSYEIRGLAPGQYYVYVHSPPPAFQEGLGPGDVVLPKDDWGRVIPAGGFIQTEFYPGVKNLTEAGVVSVKAGEVVEGIDFTAKPASSLPIYDVTTYSFPGQVAVKPAFVNPNGRFPFLVAWGRGLSVNNQPAPGLTASLMGGAATVPPGGVQPYAPAPSYIQVNLQFQPFSGGGPQHLLFGLNGALHVSPSGLHLVAQQPPLIESVSQERGEDGQELILVKGSQLGRATQIYWDGYPGRIVRVQEDSGLLVAPPPGADAHRSSLVALNPDGQTSNFLHAPPSFRYPPAPAPDFNMEPSWLPAGVEAMVEITGKNTNFRNGFTTVGFGAGDVYVKRMWVLGEDRILANIAVGAAAPQTASTLSVVSGFQTMVKPFGFRVGDGETNRPVLDSELTNPLTAASSIYAGGFAVMRVARASVTSASELKLTIDGAEALITGWEANHLVFQIPADLKPGPAIVRLKAGGVEAWPIVIQIDPPPPVIRKVLGGDGKAVGGEQPIRVGDLLKLEASGLVVGRQAPTLDRVGVQLDGVALRVVELLASEQEEEVYLIAAEVGEGVAGGGLKPLQVLLDGRPSLPVMLPVAETEKK